MRVDPKRGGGKHLRSDRSARETTFNKHLNHPFTDMQPFVQHTCTLTQTLKKRSGISYKNYYFHDFLRQVGQINVKKEEKKNTLNLLKPQQAS